MATACELADASRRKAAPCWAYRSIGPFSAGSLPLKSSLPLYFSQCLPPDVLLIFWPAIIFFLRGFICNKMACCYEDWKICLVIFLILSSRLMAGECSVCVELRQYYQYCLHTPLLWMHTYMAIYAHAYIQTCIHINIWNILYQGTPRISSP